MGRKKKTRRPAGPGRDLPEPVAPASGGLSIMLVAGLAVGGTLAGGAYLFSRRAPSADPAAPPVASATTGLPDRPTTVRPEVGALLDHYEQRVAAAPDDAERFAEVGLVYEANRMWPQALVCYERAADLQPGEPLWALHRGVALGEVGQTADALRILRTAGERFPGDAAVQQHLGVLLLEHGLLDEADTALTRARAAAPRAPSILTDLGDLRLRQQRVDEAVEVLESALALAADNARTSYVLGLAYRAAGRLDEARRALTNGIDSQRNYVVDRWSARIPEFELGLLKQLERAQRLMDAGQNADAVAILERLTRSATADVNFLVNLAVAYQNMGRYDAALSTLKRCLALAPDQFAVHINLAAVYLATNRPSEALTHLDRAIELAPELAHPHLVRGRALRRLDRPEAYDALLEARRLDPDNGDIHAELGDWCLGHGRFAEARDHFAECARLRPGQWQAHVNLAYASFKAGDPAAARAQLAAAEQLAPNQPDVVRLRQWIEEQP